MSRGLGTNPSVVLDTVALRALGRSQPLPTDFNFVILDIAMLELLSTDSADPTGLANKVVDLFRRCGDRLLVSKYWQDVSRSERTPGCAMTPDDLIHWELTYGLRGDRLIRQGDISAVIEELKPLVQEHAKTKRTFVELVKERTTHLRSSQHYSSSLMQAMRGSGRDQIDYIRRSDLAVWLHNLPQNDRYRHAEWSKVLSVFPDIHAIARWFRALEWYSMRHVIGFESRFENCYEDALVAWTSSYSGILVTNDIDLRLAVNALFPRVRVVSVLSELDMPHAIAATDPPPPRSPIELRNPGTH